MSIYHVHHLTRKVERDGHRPGIARTAVRPRVRPRRTVHDPVVCNPAAAEAIAGLPLRGVERLRRTAKHSRLPASERRKLAAGKGR